MLELDFGKKGRIVWIYDCLHQNESPFGNGFAQRVSTPFRLYDRVARTATRNGDPREINWLQYRTRIPGCPRTPSVPT